MQGNFEDLLAELRNRPPSGSLLGLEPRVWAAITAQQRGVSATAIWGWRSAAAALLLTVGVMAEGAKTNHPSPELDLFTSRTALAPSTLLGEDR